MTGGLHLDRRVAHAGQAVSYLFAVLPLAALSIVVVLALVLGAALSVVGGLGLPLLLAASAAGRRLVGADRRLANRFLDAQIPPLPSPATTTGTWWRRSVDLLGDRTLWRTVAQLALRPVLSAALLVVAVAPVLLLAELVVLAARAIGGWGDTDYFGPWEFGPGVGIVLAVLALPAAVIALATLDALRTLQCTIACGLLSPRVSAGGGPVREMLAESLGDHSISIAYWLPDRELFVDEVGRPAALPDAGSGRAWTAVERDGRRVAAIIHDASLDTTSELVEAAAAASSLALDNERLKADLRARLEELRISRLRIVEATDETRRRIERDLHDGAQQQLVALALELRLLKAKLHDPAEGGLIDGLSERLATALAELRELARGIHPAILTERGLRPAVAALAERGTVLVECDVQIQERLPPAIEAAAYFLVAEALTNITKYAEATEASVEIRREEGAVHVVVVDDGKGGVDLDAGSGLRGLQDRLAAVDGTLTIDSPPGGGTRLHAVLPVATERRTEPDVVELEA